MKIIAMRHGQTDLNFEGRVQGCKSDLPLNREGEKQAGEIAKVLADKGIDLIVTSPMKRAVQTAEIVAGHLDIKQDKVIKGMRLYERDFGDYEGKLMSEVNIDTLRRWSDNAPVPNGESIRELAARVFDFLDERLPIFKENINLGRRDKLYAEYRKNQGIVMLDDLSEDDLEKKTEMELEELLQPRPRAEIEAEVKYAFDTMENLPSTILFVVHGHVLRAMHWYFNGLPEEGEEIVIETENCVLYEFSTDKIPSKMSGYQIILDRHTIEEKLKRLSKSPYKSSYSACFAMCYVPGDFEMTYENYTCSVCGNKTKHSSDHIQELNNAKSAVERITKSRLKVSAMVDEREYCSRCYGKKMNDPSPVLKIRFSIDEEYHEVRTGNYYDYQCLSAFIKSIAEYQGESENMRDWHHPLVDRIDQIVRLTGLCPEIVDKWKIWVEEQKHPTEGG